MSMNYLFSEVFAVIDLYGQCSQVTITNGRTVRQTLPLSSPSLAEIDTADSTPLSAGKPALVQLC